VKGRTWCHDNSTVVRPEPITAELKESLFLEMISVSGQVPNGFQACHEEERIISKK
jgi:hypothetical protein